MIYKSDVLNVEMRHTNAEEVAPMGPLLTLEIIELRHQELRADAARARRPAGAGRGPNGRSFTGWVRGVARRRHSSQRAPIQSAA